MPRLLLSLLPIPVLALVAALSCGRSRSEEPATRVIPPPSAYQEPAATAAAAAAPAPEAEEPPSPEEVQAFERPVAK
jgi:hypothetical protein